MLKFDDFHFLPLWYLSYYIKQSVSQFILLLNIQELKLTLHQVQTSRKFASVLTRIQYLQVFLRLMYISTLHQLYEVLKVPSRSPPTEFVVSCCHFVLEVV